jgi:hypothetical protein
MTPEQEKQMREDWKKEALSSRATSEDFRAGWTRCFGHRQPEIDSLIAANAELVAERDNNLALYQKAMRQRDEARALRVEMATERDALKARAEKAEEEIGKWIGRAQLEEQRADRAEAERDFHQSQATELQATVASQAAEIERLRAVVERLPKTADGVPYLPGSPLFLECSGIAVGGTGYMFTEKQDPSNWSVCDFRKIKDCYSTREAALAAKGIQ